MKQQLGKPRKLHVAATPSPAVVTPLVPGLGGTDKDATGADAPLPIGAEGEAAGGGRMRLLLVAMRLFATRGFDGVSVRDIAADAEVSPGLIKHHFGSKEGLRDAVDEYFLRRSSAAFEQAIEAVEAMDADAFAEYERSWLTRYANEWPDFVAYLRRAILEASPWGHRLFRNYFESIRRTTDRWDVAGRVAADTDRLWMPLLYSFLVLGPLVLDPHIKQMLGRSTYEPDMWVRFQKAVIKLLWHGIGTPPDRS